MWNATCFLEIEIFGESTPVLSLIINEGEQIWLRIICYKLFNSKKSWEVIKVSRCNRIREKDVVFFVTRHTQNDFTSLIIFSKIVLIVVLIINN